MMGSLKPGVGWFGRQIDPIAARVRYDMILTDNYPVGAFKNGNVIQLVSRASGKTLRILAGPSGQFMVDGRGPLDKTVLQTCWTVVKQRNSTVRLCNNDCYLAVMGGYTTVVHKPSRSVDGDESRFMVDVSEGKYVTLESVKEPDSYVGVESCGDMKPATNARPLDGADFEVKLVFVPEDHDTDSDEVKNSEQYRPGASGLPRLRQTTIPELQIK